MDNRIKQQNPSPKAGIGKAGANHASTTHGTIRPLAATRARALAVQRLNSFGKSRKGVPMGDRETTQGWKISQVERLIDLPRRDIQRSCYSGQGGVSILEPVNSTWGKRLYSVDDIARLMLVKLYKDLGYCLPEIRGLLESTDTIDGTINELETWQARLEEEHLEVELKLNRVRALLGALEDDLADTTSTIESLVRSSLSRASISAIKDFDKSSVSDNPSPNHPTDLEEDLNKPGIDLILDLWIGPGAYDRIADCL